MGGKDLPPGHSSLLQHHLNLFVITWLPHFEWIVKKAREHGLAGATVLRGLEGFGVACNTMNGN